MPLLSNGRVGNKGRPMPRGRALQELKLTTGERERLFEWTRRHKSAQALRSRISRCPSQTVSLLQWRQSERRE